MTPIFSSDQASDRVRGIFVILAVCSYAAPLQFALHLVLRQERLDVGIRRPRAQLEALPSKWMRPSFSMMNSAWSAFFAVGLRERHARRSPCRGVLGDEEGVAQLVRDEHRADALEIAQLDDLLVDRERT